MKTARQWTNEFCNRHVIPSKGNVVEDFVKAIQADAINDLAHVCSEAYQIIGALDGPEKLLDNLHAAISGEKIPHETLLPFLPFGEPK